MAAFNARLGSQAVNVFVGNSVSEIHQTVELLAVTVFNRDILGISPKNGNCIIN